MTPPAKATAKNGNASSGRGVAAKGKPKRIATVPHLSVAERVARGKAARKEVPRAGHALFEPTLDAR